MLQNGETMIAEVVVHCVKFMKVECSGEMVWWPTKKKEEEDLLGTRKAPQIRFSFDTFSLSMQLELSLARWSADQVNLGLKHSRNNPT